jgi:iron complex outermembrane receptor protein
MTFRLLRAAVLAGVSASFFSTAAFAQLETIVVTAEKRAENIQTVPIAITAISGDQLRAAKIRDFNDLQQIAPSLLVSTGSGDTTGGLVRIRGVGTTGNNAGLEASVGVFVDGVYRNRSGAVLEDLLAIERIEVLRGPQGTLFGKNTTAGAISIISTKPSHGYFSTWTVEGGTLGTARIQGEVNDGVTDTLAVDVSGIYYRRDGFLTDVNDHHHANARNHFALKGQALWSPTPDIDVHVIADYAQKSDSSTDATFKLYSTRTRLLQDIVQSPLSANFGKVFVFPVTLGPTGPANQPVDFRTYKIASNFQRLADVNDGGLSAEVDWTINENASLVSISAWRDFTSLDNTDTDYTPADFIRANGSTSELRNFTQEFQLKGSWENVEWLAGLFYSDEKVLQTTDGTFGSDASLAWAHILLPTLPVGADGGSQTVKCILGEVNTNALCVANGLGGVHTPLWQAGDGVNWNFRTHGNSVSIFTHDTWNISPEWSATLGVRYNHETKHGSFDGGVPVWHTAAAQLVACGTTNPPTPSNALVGALAIFCGRQSYNQVVTEEAVTGTGDISWKPTDKLMFYASYSRGYKAPPFNLDPSWHNAGAVNAFVKSEYDDNVELGARSQFFDDMAIVNVTLFHERFRNFQINTFNGLTFAVTNFRHAFADGFEVETVLAPTEGLTLNNSATFADSRYGKDIGPTAGFPAGSPVQLAGRQLTQAPLWTINSGFDYTQELGFWDAKGFVSASANYRSHYNTGSDLNPNKTQSSFATVNAQFGIRSNDQQYELAVWGRNIFNEHYNVVAFNTPVEQASGAPSINSAISVFPGDPATYGLSLTIHEQ